MARAVVFDLDDTLYPERDYVRSGYRAVARHLDRKLGRREPFEQWLWDRFCRGQSDRAFDGLSEAFGLGLDADQIRQLVEVYREHRPRIRPRRFVPDLLAHLRSLGPVGLISDGFLPAQQHKLEALGLTESFDCVLFTESIGRQFWKPHPIAFERMAERLGCRHADCLYVGDNPAKDFDAPNRLGWRTVQLALSRMLHSDKPALPGGRAQIVARDARRLRRVLNDFTGGS